MKIRNGFVSNSSSSSFVIITEQIKELDEFFYYNGYFYCWDGNFEDVEPELLHRGVYINDLIRNGAIFIVDNLSFVSYNNEINLFEKVDVEVSENISYEIKFGMDFLYFNNTDVLKINILKKLKRREKLKKLNGEIIYYKNDDELLFKNTNFYINRIEDLWHLYNYLVDIDEREQSIRKMDNDDVLIRWQKLKDLYNQDLNSLKADLKEVLRKRTIH